MSNDKNDERLPLTESVRRDILKTGYPTEVITASLLDSYGWNTVLAPAYLDEYERQSREFDVLAMRDYPVYTSGQDIFLSINLLIECKKSDKPWTFFVTSNESEKKNDPFLGRFIQSTNSPLVFGNGYMGAGSPEPFIRNDDWATFHHYIQTNLWSHNFYEPFKGLGNTDQSLQIHPAIRSVLGATRFYCCTPLPSGLISVFYPLIIFDGNLFEISVKPTRDVEVIPTDHVVLKYNYIANDIHGISQRARPQTILIDIIRHSYIYEYSTRIDRESYTMKELIRIAGEERRSDS